MAQKVAGSFQEYNMGSRNPTHKTMNIKSNVKGVSEFPTMVTPEKGIGEGNKTTHTLPKEKVGTHY